MTNKCIFGIVFLKIIFTMAESCESSNQVFETSRGAPRIEPYKLFNL